MPSVNEVENGLMRWVESQRSALQQEINENALDRAQLEAQVEIREGGPVWDTEELQRDFAVDGFLAPFVFVTTKVPVGNHPVGTRGSLFFQHDPRFYWGFEAE